MKSIVALGGGHGLSMVMRSLADLQVRRTAIVSVADDGGSSGRLRQDLDIVAPGDIRACMLAMTRGNSENRAQALSKVFDYRFDAGELDGHSLGNLILVALARELGSFEAAVESASYLLDIDGHVYPATESSVVLCAETSQGLVRGQVQIEKCSGIERVFMDPGNAPAIEGVVDAIKTADRIIYAPGSLFTSVIPTFVIKDIADAVTNCAAPVTMVMNLVNRGPDTQDMSGDDHLGKVLSHGGRVNQVLCDVNSLVVKNPPPDVEVVIENICVEPDVHDAQMLGSALKMCLSL